MWLESWKYVKSWEIGWLMYVVCCEMERIGFYDFKDREDIKLGMSRNTDVVGGVRVMVKEELWEKMMEIRSMSNRIMAVVLVFWRGCAKDDLCVCSTKWKKFGRYTSFFMMSWKMSGYRAMKLLQHCADDLVVCLGDINSHVGGYIDGFDDVCVEHGVDQRSLEGRILLEFCLRRELCVSNTWCKRGKCHSEWEKTRQKLTLCWPVVVVVRMWRQSIGSFIMY